MYSAYKSKYYIWNMPKQTCCKPSTKKKNSNKKQTVEHAKRIKFEI